MKIETNTRSKLQKIMEGTTFSDSYTFLTELLQNSQRARATKVTVTCQNDTFIFSDNGCGCKSPASVLTLDSSDWKSTNEGFGIGFMSIFAVPKLQQVEIRSCDWVVHLDISRIIEGDLEYETQKADHINGFVVTLISEFFEEEEHTINRKLRNEAQYITNFSTIYNGEEILRKSVFDDYSPCQYAIRVNNSTFEGILEISRWGSIAVYHEDRFVCDTYGLTKNVSGIIMLKSAKGLLKEPDRKDFVKNTKFYRLQNLVNKYANILYRQYVEKYGFSDESAVSGIIANLSEREIEERLDFSQIFAATKKSDSNKEIVEITETDCIQDEQKSRAEELIKMLSEAVKESITDRSSFSENNSCCQNKYISLSDNQAGPKDIRTAPVVVEKKSGRHTEYNSSDTLKELKKSLKVAFWVRADEVESYKNQIAEAKYYDIPVVISPNQLYDISLRKRCPHISDIAEHLVVEFVKKDVRIKNSKEETFLSLLAPICRKYGLSLNTFRIANLQMKVGFIKNGRSIYKNTVRNTADSAKLYGLTSEGCIYLDRNILRLKDYKIKKCRFSLQEYRCLMNAIETISHELAHLLYSTQDNTVEHFKTELEIQSEIMRLY